MSYTKWEEMQKIVGEMDSDEKLSTIIFYLKDIKDLLENFADHFKIEKKHL